MPEAASRSAHPALSQWQLAIAGWNQGTHESELKALAEDYQLNSSIKFLGPLYGEAKAAAYSRADAIVLPSLSEGLPMAVLEAWSYGKPVLLTPQCNLPEGVVAGAAIEALPNVNALAKGLANLIEASDCERIQMGQRGWQLVNQRFTWAEVCVRRCFPSIAGSSTGAHRLAAYTNTKHGNRHQREPPGNEIQSRRAGCAASLVVRSAAVSLKSQAVLWLAQLASALFRRPLDDTCVSKTPSAFNIPGCSTSVTFLPLVNALSFTIWAR